MGRSALICDFSMFSSFSAMIVARVILTAIT